MESKKENALQKTYQLFIDSFLDLEFPIEQIDQFVDTEINGYGTTIDEHVTGLDDYIRLIHRQRDQSKGAELKVARRPVLQRISPNEDAALIIEELAVTLAFEDDNHEIPLRISSILHFIDGGWRVVHWHSSQPVASENDTWHLDEWRQKNEALQKLVDQQTADLSVKNRELEIEAAIERVRAKSMAMQKSEDLADLSKVLVQQVQELGVETWFCAFNIYDEAGLGSLEWGCNGESTFPSYRTPREGVFLKYYEAGQQGESLFINEINEKDCPGHYDYLCSLPGVGDQLLKMKSQGIPFPKTQIDHVAFFKFGYLLLITYDPAPEAHSIFRRFAKVFEQTYTRFLDLQKAEAQAREAQIEAALERVRSASLAMHETEELGRVVKILFEQFSALNLNFYQVWINAFKLEEGLSNCWFSPVEGVFDEPYTAVIPLGPFEASTVKSWKAGEEFSYLSWSGRANVDRISAELTAMTGHPSFQKIQKMKKMDRMEVVDCNNKYGVMAMANNDEISKLDKAILKRFTKVFEQAYTRFLDLQKAEAQAREAQIEAALERVRAASMAMHKSSELQNVLKVVFNQFIDLRLGIDIAIIALRPNDSKDWIGWTQSESTGYSSIHWPYVDLPVFNMLLNAWNVDTPFTFSHTLEEKNKFWKEFFKLGILPKNREKILMESPGLEVTGKYLSHSGIHVLRYSQEKFKPQETEIVARFAHVFEQTYIRFMDLQRAEAQAREAKIEAALERVRSRSLAMHKSEELQDVINTAYYALNELGINMSSANFDIFNGTGRDFYSYISGPNSKYPPRIYIPAIEYGPSKAIMDARERGDDFIVYQSDKQEMNRWLNFAFEHTDMGKVSTERKEHVRNSECWTISVALNKYSAIQLNRFSKDLFSDRDNDILMRFGKVFEQAYTRFMDLQKAEAQAREAKIEAALERVRTASITMQRGDELSNVISVVFKQLVELGFDADGCALNLFDEQDGMDTWMSGFGEEIHPEKFHTNFFDHPYYHQQLNSWKNQIPFEVLPFAGDLKRSYDEQSFSNPDYFNVPDDIRKAFIAKNIAISSSAYMRYGMLEILTDHPISDDEVGILVRFAKVFEQTYTRFLDLKKAEAQTREAEIELSLERIRAAATAMTTSKDLQDVVVTMRKEFVDLGHEAHYFWHMRWLPDRYDKAMTTGEGDKIGMVMRLPRHIHGDIPLVADWEKSDAPVLVFPMDADTAVNYVDKMVNLGDFQQLDPNAPTEETIQELGGVTFIMARTTHGEIGYSLNGKVTHPPQDAIDTLARFAGTFDLAYRRFEDLLKAEVREKEAVKQASIDRVRAEIASMRSPKDLERITPLVWKELTVLGVPFFRCGVFIIKEEDEMVHAYLSTPTGKSLAALHIPFNATEIGLIQPSIDHWRNQTVYREEWDQKQFVQNMKLFMKQGLIENAKQYQAGGQPPERLVLQLVPFKQGMLYVGNSEELSNDHIALIKSLAAAFAVAYSRYEDFVQLEEAKQAIEKTLADLKAAQNQLVHSEKMASLGELTAGIAHEIQNPLNFVNNFSDLNKELIEELQEAIAQNDTEEVNAILADLSDNETKITHHGKRAEQIVKSMLQHSRSSSGEKVPTDINGLADEYLRLAYHGLRAKDKSFNADFKMDFDPSLPMIKVVAQDIGRVLLNLINNAFQAVQAVNNPEVIVSTKSNNGQIEIRVSDNGPGIPDDIKDKIFQPFFTTKPTGEGTGLGLSMSYDIVTKGHGGELNIKSHEGEGSEFVIRLPLV